MDPVRTPVRRDQQRVGVGRLELRGPSPVEDAGRQVVAGPREFLKRGGPRRPLPAGRLLPARQSEPAEEDVADLLGRSDLEGFAGETVDDALELHQRGPEILRQPVESRAVDLDAGRLHPREHGHHRLLEVLVDAEQIPLPETRFEDGAEPQRRIGLLRSDRSGLARETVSGTTLLRPVPHRSAGSDVRWPRWRSDTSARACRPSPDSRT